MGRIAIIGAGIGGLCAGRAVALAGHEPLVLERSETDTAVGAGLLLWPNAVIALDRLGHGEAVRAAAAVARRTAIRATGGATLAEMDVEALGRSAGAPMLLIERASLHRLLAEGLTVRTGACVTGVGEGELTLLTGERIAADAVIGADGINSVTRAAISPDSTIMETGHTVIRGIADHDIGAGNALEIWGSGELVGAAALPHARTYWFYEAATAHFDGRAPLEAIDADRWPGPIPAVVACTDPTTLLVNRVRTISPPRTWTKGTTALLGDAAHAMAPNLGQGAAQAIQDAVALRTALESEPILARAMSDYAAARRPRAQTIQRESARVARLALTRHRRARDLLMRAVPDAVRGRVLERLLQA